jgi:tRNA(Ile)-lysidine synthase
MGEIETHITELLNRYAGRNIAVACSGGIDSMVLLHVLVKLNYRPKVLHVNYQLRGSDSDLDEAFINQYCTENKLQFELLRIDLKSQLECFGGNLQQEARKVRYDFFKSKTDDESVVLLAHHADDQVETFFLNLARGGGIMGLSCMLEENGIYVRPLLSFFKEEIRLFAKNEGVNWREDVSNYKIDYARNKLRTIFIPQMEAFNSGLKKQILLLIEQFQCTQKALAFKIRPLVNEVIETNTLKLEVFDELKPQEINEFIRLLDLKPTFSDRLMKLRYSENGKILKCVKGKFVKIVKEENAFRFLDSLEIKESKHFLFIEKNVELPSMFDKSTLYINPEKINGKLNLRYWRKGDRIRPIGLEGSKLVSDVLKDAKIPLSQKAEQLIVHDEQHVLWIVGHCVSRDAIADKQHAIWKVSVDRKQDSLTLPQ